MSYIFVADFKSSWKTRGWKTWKFASIALNFTNEDYSILDMLIIVDLLLELASK